MHLIYIDESGDRNCCVFSALAIEDRFWKMAFQRLRQFRKELKKTDGILLRKEFHARDFVAGRGKLGPSTVGKYRRNQIFRENLRIVAAVPGALLFNCISESGKLELAFEYLINRINRTMEAKQSYAIIISDEGHQRELTKLMRKMTVFNPIPSQFGTWMETGKATKNITIDRVLEDPFFKDSQSSLFIQAVDFCAYALLRMEFPLPSKNRYGMDEAFLNLEPILVKEAYRKDPRGLGIIRSN